MGRNILRRKALNGALLAAFLAVPAFYSGAAALTSPDAASAAPTETAAVEAGDGPLPPAQGYEAAEVFSIPIPDEDIIGRFVDGYLARPSEDLKALAEKVAGALRSRGGILLG